jgi:hypothetical protein
VIGKINIRDGHQRFKLKSSRCSDSGNGGRSQRKTRSPVAFSTTHQLMQLQAIYENGNIPVVKGEVLDRVVGEFVPRITKQRQIVELHLRKHTEKKEGLLHFFPATAAIDRAL